MSDIQECKTSRLSWAVASNLIGNRVSEILGHTVDCNAIPDSYDYWSTGLLGYRMPLSELHYLSETMHLDDSEIAESLQIVMKRLIRWTVSVWRYCEHC